MKICEVTTRTPNYVLLDANGRIGPKVTSPKLGRTYKAIYGFSDKARYDEFALHSEMKLVPYPLVKGYLQNQINAVDDSLRLIVIDSIGFDDPAVDAATIKAVLEAQENKVSHLTASYRLDFDQKTSTYSVI